MVSLPAFSSFLLTMTPASFFVLERSFRLFASTYFILRESQRIMDRLLRTSSPASSDVSVKTASSMAVLLSFESEFPRTRRLSSLKLWLSESTPMKNSSSRVVSRDEERAGTSLPPTPAPVAAAFAFFLRHHIDCYQ